MREITPGSHAGADSPPPGSPGASPNVGPVRDSVADLPAGAPTGAVRAADEAPSAVVGARRPLDIGQDLDLPAGTGAATVGTSTLLGLPATRQAVQPAFDDHHPPDAALIGDCVHCGFCLPTCPTGSGIDIVLALDASLSMMAADERPNRLERMKQEVRRLRDQ